MEYHLRGASLGSRLCVPMDSETSSQPSPVPQAWHTRATARPDLGKLDALEEGPHYSMCPIALSTVCSASLPRTGRNGLPDRATASFGELPLSPAKLFANRTSNITTYHLVAVYFHS